MDDATRPELEFLRTRELEFRQELEEHAAALGIPAITERTVGDLLQGVIEALRYSGNEVLAAKYAAAFNQFTVADKTFRDHLDDEAARDAMNDALETFERLEAEVSAWFDHKAGA